MVTDNTERMSKPFLLQTSLIRARIASKATAMVSSVLLGEESASHGERIHSLLLLERNRPRSVQIRSKHFQFCLADLQGHPSANRHQASSWHYCSKLIPTILLSTTSLRACKKIRGLWKIRTECSSISKTRLLQNKVTCSEHSLVFPVWGLAVHPTKEQ